MMLLNTEQVRRGMAWVYRQYSKDRARYALESDARAARRGLWADSQPAPPWEWRKMATGQAPMLGLIKDIIIHRTYTPLR